MEALTPVVAETNQSILLPVSYRFSQLKEYFRISWRFVSRKNHLIIMESRNKCTMQEGTEEHVCLETVVQHLAPEYRDRVMLLANASLLIQNVGSEDAGIYEVSIHALDVSAMKIINLSVIRGTGRLWDGGEPAGGLNWKQEYHISNCLSSLLS
ncbi:hypothetical protein NDU88_013327 [Pleurodeles waltl]|uniref:Immunoglobulin V-set domain-containing protein n=1 Tax=Pleurodeles waltl TaxID=8319 RepID=A0AAV7R8M8_PLEWA|nr:hypothetical protein NDU88_013327 [Pleurodeles waltl]